MIDTTSVNTGSTVFNGHIQGEDFFDTAKYPTATFKSTKVVFEGDQPTTIEGDLTIKGITKPVTLKVTHFATKLHPMMKKEAVGANATTVIKRSDFNLSKYVPNVGDEVTITVALGSRGQVSTGLLFRAQPHALSGGRGSAKGRARLRSERCVQKDWGTQGHPVAQSQKVHLPV